ncbi:cell death abnormality protein 1-like [Ostrea edulis]|uniref:cell death abnormality protein 1-like n=1 Tax=Ostrea edulis TaxID=37623 RepID=UPI0024AEDC90|nr:cell death abnormality protein 1-like [Ostrea edulis]
MKFLIFFFTAEILSKVFSAENCGSFGKCCNGYVWDDQSGSCKRCSRGFYGPKCENYCPYPTYGQECQSLCNCIQQLCHPINGCKDSLKIRYTTGQTLFSKTIEGKYIPTNGSQPTKEVSVTENSTETYEDIPKGDKDTICRAGSVFNTIAHWRKEQRLP